MSDSTSTGAGLASIRFGHRRHRVASLVHRWLGLIEDPTCPPHLLAELLVDGFELSFSGGPITSLPGLQDWHQNMADRFAANTGDVQNLVVGARDGDPDGHAELAVDFDFEWAGIASDGTVTTARTHHRWTVIDRPDDRFARAKTMHVEVLRAFTEQP